MNIKKNSLFLVIVVITLLLLIVFTTYAYFASNATVSNVANLNAVSENNNMLFDTIGGAMVLNVTAVNMTQALSGNIAAENNTTLTVNFQANTNYSMVCSYDIVYEWTSTDKYQAHTAGVTTNEFTIQAELASNSHVYEGTNNIHNETDFTTVVGNQNSATVVSGAQIDSTGISTSTAVWNISSKFYNVLQNQSSLAGKTYEGRFKVTNVSCVAGNVSSGFVSLLSSYWYADDYDHYYFPDIGGTVKSTGQETGHTVYIGQDDNKYYVCAFFSTYNVEVCLPPSYTNYTEGSIIIDYVISEEQQDIIKSRILQIFNDAGINIDSSSCVSDSSTAGCYAGEIGCRVGNDGMIDCVNDTRLEYCAVYSNAGSLSHMYSVCGYS